MEFGEEFIGVFDVGSKFPAIPSRTVSNPAYVVLKTIVSFGAGVNATVEDSFDFVLDVAVDLDGGRGRFDAVRNGVRCIGFEEADVEDGVD